MSPQAASLVQQCPVVLKLPVETKLQPVLTALTALGLNGDQVAQLIRSCPKLLAESKDSVVSRWVGDGLLQQQQQQQEQQQQ
jgi:hypothetical protein